MSVTGAINKFRLMPVPGPHRLRAVTLIGSESMNPSMCEFLDRTILEVSEGWLVENVETRYENTRIRWLCIEFDANEKTIKEKLQAAFSLVQSIGNDHADLQVSIEPEAPQGGWSYLPTPRCFLTGEQAGYGLGKTSANCSEEIYTSAGLARAIAVIYREMAKPTGTGWDDRTF